VKYSILNNYNNNRKGKNIFKYALNLNLKNLKFYVTTPNVNIKRSKLNRGNSIDLTNKVIAANKNTLYLQASLKAPVGILKISLRAYTALKKAGIFTLSDLLTTGLNRSDLLKIKNLGIKSLFEIEKSLSYLGLTLE
jgi:DNA-directed RNA polymerase alpha subunit